MKLLGMKMDLTMLAILSSGNDYLPGLKGINLDSKSYQTKITYTAVTIETCMRPCECRCLDAFDVHTTCVQPCTHKAVQCKVHPFCTELRMANYEKRAARARYSIVHD